MLNKFIGIGRLGENPTQKWLTSGKAVVNFSVATSNRYKKDGEYIEKTEWHRIVAFDKLAEICGKYLKKGSLVYIEGSLQTRSWDDKDGVKRYTTEILAREMEMLDKREEPAPAAQEDGIPF